MTDQEFIELINLYVDREITAQDAARLEAAVLASPRRRSIYNQYCKIQKACSMLSEEYAESGSDTEAAVFPQASLWRPGPLLAGLAAACLLAVVGLRFRGALAGGHAFQAATEPAATASLEPRRSTDSMQAVYFAHAATPQPSRGMASFLASTDVAPQAEQLNWIGDIHLDPVAFGTGPDFMLTQKADLKAAVLSDSKDGRDAQQPAEMTAFRFQR